MLNDNPVLNLCGLPGTGKTRLLTKFDDKHPGILQIISPNAFGEVFDPAVADFDAHSAVAIDEVGQWERDSIRDGVAALKAQVVDTNKKLILVTQRPQDLSRFGIQLLPTPSVIELQGKLVPIELHFDGRSIRFAKPVAA